MFEDLIKNISTILWHEYVSQIQPNFQMFRKLTVLFFSFKETELRFISKGLPQQHDVLSNILFWQLHTHLCFHSKASFPPQIVENTRKRNTFELDDNSLYTVKAAL